MDDLISRQAAIDAVEKESQADGAYGYMDTKSIVDLLNDLPSAQSGRKKGKWIKRSVSLYRCSECGRFHPAQENFCPSCGAEMEKNDEV